VLGECACCCFVYSVHLIHLKCSFFLCFFAGRGVGGGTIFCRRSQWDADKFPRKLFYESRSKAGAVLMHSKMIIGTFRDVPSLSGKGKGKGRETTDTNDSDTEDDDDVVEIIEVHLRRLA